MSAATPDHVNHDQASHDQASHVDVDHDQVDHGLAVHGRPLVAGPRKAGGARVGSRRRGAELEQAIFGAVWEELATLGYAGLTIEGVAARARTSRTVIYRRWSTRAQLVVAAMSQGLPQPTALPDTGDLRTDVITLLVRLERRFENLPADALSGLMFEVLQDPEAMKIREQVVQPQCTDLIMILMGRAAARGEIDPRMIRPRVASLPKDLVRNEYLTRPGGGHVPEAVIAEIVDEIFLPLVRPTGPAIRRPDDPPPTAPEEAARQS
ncbi:hypothetical protein FAIPA1_160021 [Frankia sp. AiPs1]|uniref:TetR/AcrR family transcriptional regulator n=1 Tax=Frankia sp. AiPa1 TaxID=573492 RepID=UPI00202B6775|nr:TetR/AcrR family transcriptional regulator [Frankia sp. AiPa1]MCL9758938.1 TetR/AcrR family transcriptional regulator [Frankia sp. AiPa1]